jgi:hypothetical protein
MAVRQRTVHKLREIWGSETKFLLLLLYLFFFFYYIMLASSVPFAKSSNCSAEKQKKKILYERLANSAWVSGWLEIIRILGTVHLVGPPSLYGAQIFRLKTNVNCPVILPAVLTITEVLWDVTPCRCTRHPRRLDQFRQYRLPQQNFLHAAIIEN